VREDYADVKVLLEDRIIPIHIVFHGSQEIDYYCGNFEEHTYLTSEQDEEWTQIGVFDALFHWVFENAPVKDNTFFYEE
jgi:hypothetical protein